MSKSKKKSGKFRAVESSELLDAVKELRENGYRFCQACADNRDGGFELLYTFAAQEKTTALRVNIAEDKEVDSITFAYWTAFASELDMARDFGISFKHIASEHMGESYNAEKLSASGENIRREAEFLMEGQAFGEMIDVAERMPGMSSFGNSMGYCMATEAAMGTEVPERAVYLRVILHEMCRIESHLFWLASLAEDIGFESLAAMCWNAREGILDVFDEIAGNRIILGICCVGGLKKDVSQESLDSIVNEIDSLRRSMQTLADIFCNDSSVQARLRGIGIVDKKMASEFCVGPVAKASGVGIDARCDEKLPLYKELGFVPVTEEEGDCEARCRIRIREICQSADLIEAAMEKLPEGEFVAEEVKPRAGEAVIRVEQPDGQAFYYSKVKRNGRIKRFDVRMPADINMPAFVAVMEDCDPVDLDILALTMDPCVRDVKW